MGGWLQCYNCDKWHHTHNGGAYISGNTYCENCAGEIEAFWLMREEE